MKKVLPRRVDYFKAFQFTEENEEEIKEEFESCGAKYEFEDLWNMDEEDGVSNKRILFIAKSSGYLHTIYQGTWIIIRNGVFYKVLSDEDFHALYEEVTE